MQSHSELTNVIEGADLVGAIGWEPFRSIDFICASIPFLSVLSGSAPPREVKHATIGASTRLEGFSRRDAEPQRTARYGVKLSMRFLFAAWRLCATAFFSPERPNLPRAKSRRRQGSHSLGLSFLRGSAPLREVKHATIGASTRLEGRQPGWFSRLNFFA